MTEKIHKRQSWSNSREFLLTCIGYAVGLSNIWRFPYLCYKNGGGAFLIPYLVALILCGIPIACMEFCLGQYVGLGLFPFWEICPLFKGMGMLGLLVNIGLASYYIFIIVLSVYYFCACFSKVVPWKGCDHPWNSEHCFDYFNEPTSENSTFIYGGNTTNFNISGHNTQQNSSMAVHATLVSPAEEYLTKGVLRMSDGIEDIGSINWWLFLCLVTAWVLVFLVTINSIKSSGKVVYITSTFPYIMLTVLLIGGCTMPGSWEGVYHYMLPKWEKLLEPEVWYSGMQQIFISLGIAYGCFTTLSGYNSVENNFYRDAMMTTLINSFTSIYGGFAVFAVLGGMAQELNMSIEDVVSSGPGLAFVAYPRAMSAMPLTHLCSVLFFLMLIVIGIGSMIVHFETILVCITDQFPSLRITWRRVMVSACITVVFILTGIIYVTEGGIYVFTLVDWYCTPFPLMFAALLECIIFPWLYGVDTICENSKTMIGFKPNVFFRICWKYVTPVFIFVILLVNIVTWKPATYGEYVFPAYANAIGWGIAVIPLIPLVVVAIYKIYTCDEENLQKKVAFLLKPSPIFLKHTSERATLSKDDFKAEQELDLLNEKDIC